MGSVYYNYIPAQINTPYLQPMSGLGSYARTGDAIILGGPRAGAGSASRIYNYLAATNKLYPSIYYVKEYIKAKNYIAAGTYRNRLLRLYV
jgi:hypothetical protein